MSEREIQSSRGVGRPYLIGLTRGFVISWDETVWDQAHPLGYTTSKTQIFDEELESQAGAVSTPFPSPVAPSPEAVERTSNGYVMLVRGEDIPGASPGSESRRGIFLLFVGNDGQPLGEPVRVNEDTSGIEDVNFTNLAVDGRGNVIVPFWRIKPPFSEENTDVYVRRFSPDGQPLGPEIQVNSYTPGEQTNPKVAATLTGEFLVVWQSKGQEAEHEDIYGQFFSAGGALVGHEFRVNEIALSGQRFPSVAADPHGNFIVAWRSFVPGFVNGVVFDWEIKGRLLRPDGTPVAGEIFLNQERHFEQGIPLVAFAPNGTFFAAWGGPTQATPGSEMDVHARRFTASPGEEPCAVSGSKLLCDTGRTGGEPELELTFGGRPGEVTLLGDWDGDGREDVCAWRGGRFRCDLDHEGPPSEAALAFGFPTDTPLLGDVDGDGRAEPCVRRKRRLLCDTGHNSGRAETVTVLGRGTELPLLGDLDGDGRDDLCLVEKGQWTCLTRSGSRVSFAFGGPEDLPALGDLDRDGRADPCVLSGGTLLCDTAHDGSAAESSLALRVPPGARPIFGNLDGL